MKTLVRLLLVILLAGPALGGEEPAAETPSPLPGKPPLVVEAPGVAVAGLPTEVRVRVERGAAAPGAAVEVVEARSGRRLAEGRLGADLAVALVLEPSRGGRFLVRLPELYGGAEELRLRVIPGWVTLLPPLLAILLALVFRQVVPALVAGIWVGAWIGFGGPFVGFLRTIDHYVIRALADPNHASIICFSLLLGGMVGIVSRSGGTYGLVEALTPFATTSRRGQLVTWVLGILVFFDDYANTLLVGNTMRPVTDRLRISREKLAYIVDSTAAPVTSVALVSTWIGYEVSLIADSLERIGSDADAYSVFLRSLPFNFYPLLALAFGLMVAAGVRDFGPMLRAERRALGGKLLSDTAVPLADFETQALDPPRDRPRRWINAALPVAVVLLVTFAGLWFTGRAGLVERGDPLGSASPLALGFQGLGTVFGAGDSFKALLWASLSGCLVALLLARLQGILSLGDGLGAWVNGMRSMVIAMVILVLAWGIAATCAELNTSGFMVALLSDHIDPRLLPAIVFALASITAFSTGTSWGTMGILIPLAVPTAHGVAMASGLSAAVEQSVLLGSISAVLAGAIFGDHCSPISDTTVMSSMASGCDHVDHVRTQLPYAVLVAVVAIAAGYLPAGFGLHPLLSLVLAAGVLALLLRWLGRPVTG